MATEIEREAAAQGAVTAYGDELLSVAETDERLTAVYAADTYDELMELSIAGEEPSKLSPRVRGWAGVLLLTLPICVMATVAAIATAPGGGWSKLLIASCALVTGLLVASLMLGRRASPAAPKLRLRNVQ